jgi:subfamily B ATP-binding cassette protein MsbA
MSGAAQPADRRPAGRATGGDWVTYRRLLRYVKPYWLLFLVAVLGFSLGSAAEAYFVSLFGKLIDNWQTGAAEIVLMVPLLMLGAAVARGVGEILGELLLSRISFGVVHRIRTQLFDQLLLMPSAFFDASSQGHLVSRLTYNVGQLRDTGTDALKSIIQDGSKVIVYLTYMLLLSWKLTLIFAATAPIVGLVVMYASRRFRRISRRIQNSMGDVTHVASEAVSGYRVVRIFGGESYEQARFHRSSQSNQQQHLKMVATKVTSTQLIQVFVAAALALLIALLLRPEVAGDLSTGQIVTLLGLAGMLARPVRKLTEVNARLQRGLAAAEDIFGQMDQPLERDTGTLTVTRVRGRLEFCNVGFTYARGAAPVLQGIDLVIEPGQTVALVGKSGSGKSTLASLIPRFYEPSEGRILLDRAGHAAGHPVQRYAGAQHRLWRSGGSGPGTVAQRGRARAGGPVHR